MRREVLSGGEGAAATVFGRATGGTRASEVARRSGRPKQVIGRAVDELAQLG